MFEDTSRREQPDRGLLAKEAATSVWRDDEYDAEMGRSRNTWRCGRETACRGVDVALLTVTHRIMRCGEVYSMSLTQGVACQISEFS